MRILQAQHIYLPILVATFLCSAGTNSGGTYSNTNTRAHKYTDDDCLPVAGTARLWHAGPRASPPARTRLRGAGIVFEQTLDFSAFLGKNQSIYSCRNCGSHISLPVYIASNQYQVHACSRGSV